MCFTWKLLLLFVFGISHHTIFSKEIISITSQESLSLQDEGTLIVYNDYVPTGEQLCVPSGNVVKSLRCDGVFQLPNGIDEQNCAKISEPSTKFFKCLNEEQKIWDLWVCDGIEHCADTSDEMDCDNSTAKRNLVPMWYHCNGVIECRDMQDEENCPAGYAVDQTDIPQFFTCNKNNITRKLTVRFKCDGFKDCDDGRDEINCQTLFLCADTTPTTVDADLYCKGYSNCPNSNKQRMCSNKPSEHILCPHTDDISQLHPDYEIENIYKYITTDDFENLCKPSSRIKPEIFITNKGKIMESNKVFILGLVSIPIFCNLLNS